MCKAGKGLYKGLLVLVVFLGFVLPSPSQGAEKYAEQRQELIEEIERDVSRTRSYIGKDALDPKVLESMNQVPRHKFVPDRLKDMAYENRPLPIGYGQTISQPYIVALMTDLLNPQPNDTVLEVGTGSGYQAAVLSRLVAGVHTVEIIPGLAESAGKRLEKLGYDNVNVVQGDGYYGLKNKAPFDSIIVTAAAPHIPPPLIKQLKPGGVMILPVGGPFMTQELIRVRKDQSGETHTDHLLPVRFVPLTGGH